MRLWVRHDRVVSHGRCYGQTDVHLAVAPEITAQRLYPHLPKNLPIFSSPLSRCALLAEQLTSARHPVHYLDELQEVNFGHWENQPWDTIPRVDLDAWAADVTGFQFPGGESVPEFVDRVRAALNQLPKQCIVVTHGGVIRAAHHWCLNMPRTHAFTVPVPYAAPLALPAERC